jgi:peroxiredoxin
MGVMVNVAIDQLAPDFALEDYEGNEVQLSQFRGDQYVLLVFNRGFT